MGKRQREVFLRAMAVAFSALAFVGAAQNAFHAQTVQDGRDPMAVASQLEQERGLA